MWSCLTGRMFDGTPSVVVHDVREIETWILRLLSAPVPVPGKTRVQVSSSFSSIFYIDTLTKPEVISSL